MNDSSLIEPLSLFLQRPSPEWLIESILPARDLACLYAPFSSGKSFVGVELAGAISQGRNFGGHKTRRSKVLYMMAEGISDMRERFESIVDDGRIDSDMVYVSSEAPQLIDKPTRARLRADVLNWLKGGPLGLIVVDTLARHSIGIEENSAATMGALVALYDNLAREVGATVLFIHHAGKDPDRGMRGSTALPGAVSTIILCEKEGDEITLRCEKQRGAREFEPVGFQMRQVNGSAVLDPAMSADLTSDLEQLILGVIVSTKTGIAASRDFVWPDGKVPPKMTLYRTLGQMVNSRKINKVSRGKYAKYQ